ncbi:MAG: hypothetical protein AAF587_39245, partial [Bacteroidota bacterium]
MNNSEFDFVQNGNSNLFTVHFYQFRRAGPQNSAAHQTNRLAAHQTIRSAAHQTNRLAAHQTNRSAVFTQLFAAKKLQRNLKTKENKKCTVVNKFSMRINQHHLKTAKF